MKVWEAHRDLSNSIGDSVYCSETSDPILDGVRYSKELRDSYLYRAILEINQQNLGMVKGVPNKQASFIIDRLYPTFKIKAGFLLSGSDEYIVKLYQTATMNSWLISLRKGTMNNPVDIPGILYVINAQIYSSLHNTSYSVPVKYGIDSTTLINSFNAQRPNPFLVVYSHRYSLIETPSVEYFELFDGTGIITTDSLLLITFIPVPKNPAIQTANEDLYIDDTHIPKMLTLAHIYSLIDSQDIENMEKFLPGLLKLQQQQ